MNIDLINEGAWVSVIEGKRGVQFEFLALQLFLATLRNRLQAKEITIAECVVELKAFYRKFNRLPIAEKDFSRIAHQEEASTSGLLEPAEVARRIKAGQSLMLAGEEALLATLPEGNWIGGTIPYFMAQDGGCLCKDKILVTEISREFHASIRHFTTSELSGIYRDSEEGTVSFVILPADSSAHTEFALHAPRYPNFAMHPLVGWIAGVDLTMVGKTSPKVFCGAPRPLSDGAVVMRLKLPADQLAQIRTVNLFRPGEGDTIRFPESGFVVSTAYINGQERNLAEYLQRTKADTRLPLVADYFGAMVNVSLKRLDAQTGRVEFYAPVVPGIEYRLASPVKDYVAAFEASLKEVAPESVLFSCNCILNYLHSNLEGRRTGALVGPVTFGEIAFQLLNQTLVYLEIVKVAPPRADAGETVSELVAAHEALEASERRFRALSECAPMGIFLTDPAGRVLYDNPRCRSLSGITDEEAVQGDAWVRKIHPHDVAGVMSAVQESEREGRDFDHEFRFVGPDGKARWVHSRTAVLRSDTGEPMGRIGTLEDISERKQAEIEIERVNQDLVNASREAGMAEVTNGVLHNVKNVINSINVSSSLIAEQLRNSQSANLAKVTALLREHAADLGAFITEDAKGRHLPGYLEKLGVRLVAEQEALLGEVVALTKNVEHVKEIVAMQQCQAKQGGAREIVNPVELMEDSLRIVSASLVRHGIQVEREYESNVPDVTVDRHKVLQILVNLIRNAKQACQASERLDKKVSFRVTSDHDFVNLTIQDNGVGILPGNIDQLFKHGFTTKKNGHGFGLCSSARVVQEIGGDIHVQSDGLGAGATFTLRLPLRVPSPAA